MRRVILESPYAGDTTGKTKEQIDAQIAENCAYARACARDCLLRGEAPMVSHLLYTQDGILRDSVADERKLGIEAGLAWGVVAEATVVYGDWGISGGMKTGIKNAEDAGRPVEHRSLPLHQRPFTDREWEFLMQCYG